jgi:hypothetical protein
MRTGGGGGRPHRATAILASLLLALTTSCHRRAEDAPALPPEQLANAIEAVRVVHKVAPTPPKRLDYLRPADRKHATGAILCTLTQNGRPLLLAGARRALARVDGKPVMLDLSGPMSASAAFFRAPGITISIGRHAAVEPKADAPGIAWPVGVTIGGLDTVEDEKVEARWVCGTPAVAPVRPPIESVRPIPPPERQSR